MTELEKMKENLNKGNNPIQEAFKLGFMACIESIEDKGFKKLSTILRMEHSKLYPEQEEVELSDFDKKLKKGLEYNPRN